MQFNFREQGPSIGQAATSMVDAVNGKPLTGRLGLVQSLCGVWTISSMGTHPVRKALWTTRAILSSVGVWRAYKQENSPAGMAKADPMSAFCVAHQIARPSAWFVLADILHKACASGLPYEDLTLKGETDYVIRKFTPGGAPPIFFKLYQNDAGRSYVGDGPLCARGAEDAMKQVLGDTLWKQFASNHIRLTTNSTEGDCVLELSDNGVPDPYIMDETSTEWTQAASYARRCKAFMVHGMVRSVLF